MPQTITCTISWEPFEVSDIEINLRKQFGFEDLPDVKPKYRLRELWAFYPQWALHARKCDQSGKAIISAFSENCQYPVWDRTTWYKEANPPSASIDFDRPFFDQARDLFFQCPIPHIFQSRCENCEYTDDWYESRDCYLCHGGDNCEGLRYCTHGNASKDCLFSVMIDDCHWCYDCIFCVGAHSCVHCLDVRSSRDCIMSYNLRNCSDCLFCFNLRGKQYCIGNKQFTKEEYEAQKEKWEIHTRAGYKKAKSFFEKMMREIAWLRGVYVEHAENTSGNYIMHMKDCVNCYMLLDHENAANVLWAGGSVKNTCDGVGTFGCQWGFRVTVPIRCFDIRFSYMCNECRSSDYLGYCANLESCFWCCGLYKKQNCILNTPYSKEEYWDLKNKLIDHMKSTGEWGSFFPWDFAPNPYDESISGYFFGLSQDQQQKLGFRIAQTSDRAPDDACSIDQIPETADEADESTTQKSFWDEWAKKPFRILANDVNFCRKMRVPLPDSYYVARIHENMNWVPFDGELRETTCPKTGKNIQTGWGTEYDGRILSEGAYLDLT